MSTFSTVQSRCCFHFRLYFFRLKLAIKYGQKKFVAHPNVQQLLASIWYSLNQLYPQSPFCITVKILYSFPDHQQKPSFALDTSHYDDSFRILILQVWRPSRLQAKEHASPGNGGQSRKKSTLEWLRLMGFSVHCEFFNWATPEFAKARPIWGRWGCLCLVRVAKYGQFWSSRIVFWGF